MDKILIKDLLIRGVIGISDREREQSQDILINITAYTDIAKAAVSDSIEDCVNYRTLAKRIKAYAEQANTYTVEALAARIAELCFEDPLILGVLVRVEKPGAVRFSRSVGVEIERFRP